MCVVYQQLSPDGTFTKPANSKLLYGTMSFVRAAIVDFCYWTLSRAITIAIRYSAVRRQSQLKPGWVTFNFGLWMFMCDVVTPAAYKTKDIIYVVVVYYVVETWRSHGTMYPLESSAKIVKKTAWNIFFASQEKSGSCFCIEHILTALFAPNPFSTE